MRALSLSVGLVVLLCAAGVARADVFNMGGTRNADGSWTGLASLETVAVGNPGNAPDTRYDTPGCGGVSYTYSICKYEVTAAQYCEFLNAVAATDLYGLYHTSMDVDVDPKGCNIKRSGVQGSYTYSVPPGWENRPVNRVSWGDAVRFVNWLSNGQPTGLAGSLDTTEDGSYRLNGATTDAELMEVTRKADATWVIPTEDEWYKAAYHKNNGTTGNYWTWPTATNTAPNNVLSDPDGGNSANFGHSDPVEGSFWRTAVGEFENSASPYGTFDQGGNLYEWLELANAEGVRRHCRGGYFGGPGSNLSAVSRTGWQPSLNLVNVGFRVALVPEPATLSLLALGGLAVLRRRASGFVRT